MNQTFTQGMNELSLYGAIGLSIVLFVGAATIALVMYFMTKSSKSHFVFEDMLLANNKASTTKVGHLVALCVSTWGFVYLINQGKMTEWYFFGYMSVWTGAHLLSKFMDVKFVLQKDEHGNKNLTVDVQADA